MSVDDDPVSVGEGKFVPSKFAILERLHRLGMSVVKICSPYLGWHYLNARSGFLRFLIIRHDKS